MTETETKWAERIREWRSSGKTAQEFAAGQDFEASTLRYWASELNRRARQSRPVGAAPPTAKRVRMVRVRRGVPPATATPMVIAIGAARIELRAGFDRALLREVIAALATGSRL